MKGSAGFPLTRRDSLGIHKFIWDEIEEEDQFPAGKDRILVSSDDYLKVHCLLL